MHLILHVFKKDVRHLWWGIAIALLIQAAAAWLDAIESDVSDQLSVLLVVTWAVLLVLAVHEDPLVSDRQFWITRPARWRVLLGSKLLFALAVVHVPSFLSDVLLLTAHGFRPWEWLPSLLFKQLALAALLTLPVIAIAAVLQSFAHVALAGIAIIGLTSFASSFSPGLYSHWRDVDDTTRLVLVSAVVAACAVAVIPWQFARRGTWPSRLVGMAGVLIAEVVLGFLSPIFVARVRAAADPIGTRIDIHTQTGPTKGAPGFPYRTGGLVGMTVPLSVSGIPKGMEAHFALEPLDLIGPSDQRYPVDPIHVDRNWLLLDIRQEFFDRIRNGKVELKGSVPVMLYRIGSSTSLALGASGPVPGLGRCSSEVIDRSWSLRVACESPGNSSMQAFVRVWQTPDNLDGKELDQISGLGLSPFKRSMVSFPLAPRDDPRPSWRVEITPDIPLGWQVVNLDLRDLQLRDYVLRPGQ